jgi:SHS2 domain-containing protein
LTYIEPETLLVDFLSELLFLTESEGLAFDEFSLRFESNRLIADVTGANLKSLAKEIKAVTYHNINIRDTGKDLKVIIVFDV